MAMTCEVYLQHILFRSLQVLAYSFHLQNHQTIHQICGSVWADKATRKVSWWRSFPLAYSPSPGSNNATMYLWHKCYSLWSESQNECVRLSSWSDATFHSDIWVGNNNSEHHCTLMIFWIVTSFIYSSFNFQSVKKSRWNKTLYSMLC